MLETDVQQIVMSPGVQKQRNFLLLKAMILPKVKAML